MGKDTIRTLNIVCSCNENYINPTRVMLTSVFENKGTRYNSNVYFLLGSVISKKSKDKLSILSNKYKFKLKFVKVDSLLKRKLLDAHLTTDAFNKLIFPVLVKSVSKFIYLDSDLIVLGDVEKLWEVKIKSGIIAATEEKDLTKKYLWLGKKPFFNSGVMLVDAIRYRKVNVASKTVNFTIENSEDILYQDQDGLNHTLNNNWQKLDKSWNVTTFNLKEQKLKEGHINIIHFNGDGKCKPWNYSCKNPYVYKYLKYLKIVDLNRYYIFVIGKLFRMVKDSPRSFFC